MDPWRTEASGHSLWLIPEEGTNSRLRKLILKLSRQHRSIPFAPHITLLGELPGEAYSLITTLRNQISELSSFKLSVQGVRGEDVYFRNLYLEIRASTELVTLNRTLRDRYQHHLDRSYHPHLSLLYHDLQADQREGLIAGLQDYPDELTIDRIQLVCTQGGPDMWFPVETFTLA